MGELTTSMVYTISLPLNQVDSRLPTFSYSIPTTARDVYCSPQVQDKLERKIWQVGNSQTSGVWGAASFVDHVFTGNTLEARALNFANGQVAAHAPGMGLPSLAQACPAR